MPTFDDIESSIQSSTPVELYDFVCPSQTFRLTTYGNDVVFGGNTYVSTTSVRDSLSCADLIADATAVQVDMPASHPLPQLYAAGMPPREILCTIRRYHVASGVAVQMWSGYVSGLEFKGRMATFRVPAIIADMLDVDVSGVVAQRLCNNILYDRQCTMLRTSFQVVTTISAISTDGKTITTAASVPSVAAGQTPWARFGEMLHASSTERRTLVDQLALNQFVLQVAFGNGVLHVGDAVTIQAGCDNQATTCRDKFNNILNFTGMPNLPTSNMFYVGLVNKQ